MSDSLEWYAKRGLLAASDETSKDNDERLRAGRLVCRLHAGRDLSTGLTARYAEKVSNWQSADRQLTNVEQGYARRQQADTVFLAMPPRTRAIVYRVCVCDERVGKVFMERLRCGLDALTQKNTKSKIKC